MIKYRPHRNTLSAEAKDELTFDNLDEMFGYLSDHINRIARYIKSNIQISRKDVMIDGNRNVLINRSNSIIVIGNYEE